jgi:hypothetical protein
MPSAIVLPMATDPDSVPPGARRPDLDNPASRGPDPEMNLHASIAFSHKKWSREHGGQNYRFHCSFHLNTLREKFC